MNKLTIIVNKLTMFALKDLEDELPGRGKASDRALGPEIPSLTSTQVIEGRAIF